jgi:hypothetical protein
MTTEDLLRIELADALVQLAIQQFVIEELKKHVDDQDILEEIVEKCENHFCSTQRRMDS